MRISGTEPSPVILNQTKLFNKLKSHAQKVSKQAKAKIGACWLKARKESYDAVSVSKLLILVIAEFDFSHG